MGSSLFRIVPKQQTLLQPTQTLILGFYLLWISARSVSVAKMGALGLYSVHFRLKKQKKTTKLSCKKIFVFIFNRFFSVISVLNRFSATDFFLFILCLKLLS